MSMKSILIIGLGQFGSNIAIRMSELRCEVMAVDIDEERVNEVLPYVTNAKIGDCTSEEFMRSLGINDYDVCIVALGSRFQTSLEVSSLLKELGSKQVVSRATSDVQMKFLLRNGADEVVYPEKQMALRVATKYASDSILDLIKLDSKYSIYELRVPKDWHGRTLMQMDIRKKYQITVLTVRRSGNTFVPSPDTQLQPDDIVSVLGEDKDIHRCFRL